ncbi:hypothetical protein QC763_0018470 [Podospora pseudopauciseta]|uniref:Uncharacterized protein n=2 Tax=Podospora TaxID=5144 RepID=A0ABR0I0H8_9PEZI|nr:hypothetical protein QC763_0018470 [Podospora pseudopauciseta]KAK4682366.1 hypothetical protein QC764_0018420 [Podospora pseudoanserina]
MTASQANYLPIDIKYSGKGDNHWTRPLPPTSSRSTHVPLSFAPGPKNLHLPGLFILTQPSTLSQRLKLPGALGVNP